MQEVVTHISDLKISTALTTTLKNIPDNRGLSPSHPNIFDNCAYLFLAFLWFPATAVQSSSKASRIQPMYLNNVTEFSGHPYARNTLSVLTRIYSDAILRRFLSAPLVYWVVVGWQPFRAAHITRISQQGYCGWGRFPPSVITMVSLTYR